MVIEMSEMEMFPVVGGAGEWECNSGAASIVQYSCDDSLETSGLKRSGRARALIYYIYI